MGILDRILKTLLFCIKGFPLKKCMLGGNGTPFRDAFISAILYPINILLAVSSFTLNVKFSPIIILSSASRKDCRAAKYVALDSRKNVTGEEVIHCKTTQVDTINKYRSLSNSISLMFLSVSYEQVLELFIIQPIVCFTVNVKVGFNQDVFTNEILSLISVTYELCIVITTPMSSNRFLWWGLMNFHNVEMCSTPSPPK